MTSFRCLWLVATTLLVGPVCTATGQNPPSVAKFEVLPSPLELKGDARGGEYLGILGRAAAWLGRETGEAELWVHPFKLANDFRLDFRIPDYVEPIRGSDVARTVVIRPEITTIVYSHATFTVRQHILAPLDLPGLLVLLDVSTFRPLDVVASFKTVFQYAWPGAFGGQYTFWDPEASAFVLSESLRERNALIGSPWAAAASTHPAHALPDAPNTFVIPIDSARCDTEFIPIAVAAATAPRDSVARIYRQLLENSEALYQERLEHVRSLLANTTSIDTPDDGLDLALEWSKINLDEAVVCNPDLGCGLVAGWGPSGNSSRPGFGWFFGGDAAINTLAMSATGMWTQVAQGLRFLAHYQREDGKIPHEISQAAGRIPWFTDFPYTYYHADTTPYWILALWRYWRATGDSRLLDDLWPAVSKAYAWCLSRDTDGDAIIENGPGNLGAIEVGELGQDIHQDIYLAAVWIKALEAMAELSQARGDAASARAAEELGRSAKAVLNRDYWRDVEGHHAFGILRSGGTNDNLTVWPATAAAFHLLDSAQAELTLMKLASDSISADWGARMLSTGSALYDPMHYNGGSVWPFVTGFVTWGQYNYRRPWSGFLLIDALKQATFDWARGRHPELMSGRYYRPLDTAVPQQFFATSMLLSPVIAGVLGWDPDAPNGRARLAPQVPPSWQRLSAHNLKIGASSLDVDMRQGPGFLAIDARTVGTPVSVDFILPIPLGARDVAFTVSPVESVGHGSAREGRHDGQYLITIPVSDRQTRLELTWEGGLILDPPAAMLDPGQESQGIRVLDFQESARGWSLVVEGNPSNSYRIDLHGEAVRVGSGPASVDYQEGVNGLIITFPPGEQRRIATIGLESLRP